MLLKRQLQLKAVKELVKRAPIPRAPVGVVAGPEALKWCEVKREINKRIDARLQEQHAKFSTSLELDDLRRISSHLLDLVIYFSEEDTFYRDFILDVVKIIMDVFSGRVPEFNRMTIDEWIEARDVDMEVKA